LPTTMLSPSSSHQSPLELERSDGAVIADKVGDTACTFLAGLYRAEQAIADRLIHIVSGRLPGPWIDEEKAMPWIEKRSGLQLADSQRAAIRLALMAKALVITGGPGVGRRRSSIRSSRSWRPKACDYCSAPPEAARRSA
jgi:exodeoxyribonuclease V alpha subunit